MKKLVLGLSIVTTLLGLSIALAAKPNPIDYRRSLFVPVGQKMLVMEAPKGMCFLDPSQYGERKAYERLKDMAEKQGKDVFLGAFAPCLTVAGYGVSGNFDLDLLNAGTVTWLNPSVGEQTPLDRKEYLDGRAPSFRKSVETAFKAAAAPNDKYTFDETPRVSENGMSLGFTADIKMEDVLYKSAGVVATTSLRHIPIEVMIRYTQKERHDREKIQRLADKFLAQQIALNE